MVQKAKQRMGDPIHLLHDFTATQCDSNILRPTSHSLTFEDSMLIMVTLRQLQPVQEAE